MTARREILIARLARILRYLHSRKPDFAEKRLKIFGVSNKMRNTEERATTVAGFVRDVLPAFAKEQIKPMVDRMFSMSELPAALAYMESDKHVGKIVVGV